jgi:hypothetical protein
MQRSADQVTVTASLPPVVSNQSTAGIEVNYENKTSPSS